MCVCHWLAEAPRAWMGAAGRAKGLMLGSSWPALPLQTRSSRHTQGAQPGLADQAAKLSYASAESLETMSEAELPLGFSRMNRFRQSLPLSRSASQTKLRSPGTAHPVHPPPGPWLLPLLCSPGTLFIPFTILSLLHRLFEASGSLPHLPISPPPAISSPSLASLFPALLHLSLPSPLSIISPTPLSPSASPFFPSLLSPLGLSHPLPQPLFLHPLLSPLSPRQRNDSL